MSLAIALEFFDPTNGSAVNNFIASVWKPKKAHSKIDRIKIEAHIMIGDDAVKSEQADKKKVRSLYREASTMEVTVSTIAVLLYSKVVRGGLIRVSPFFFFGRLLTH